MWQICLHIFHLVYINGGSDPNWNSIRLSTTGKLRISKFFAVTEDCQLQTGLVAVIDPNRKMNDMAQWLESACGIEEESDAVRKRHQSLLKIGEKKTVKLWPPACWLILQNLSIWESTTPLANEYEESGCDVLDWHYTMCPDVVYRAMSLGHSKNTNFQLIVTSIWGHPLKQILFQWIRNINYWERKYFLFTKGLQSVVTPSFKSVNSFGAAEHSTQDTASSPLSLEEESKFPKVQNSSHLRTEAQMNKSWTWLCFWFRSADKVTYI